MTCFICLRTGKKVFDINLPCGKGQNTIKADIIEFVGNNNPAINAYLTDDHNKHCCSVCMNVLDDIVRYKGKLMDQIMQRNLTQPDLGRIWNFVAKSEAKSEFKEKCGLMTHMRAETPPSSLSRTSTPSVCLVSKTKSYDHYLEKQVERREGFKSDAVHRVKEYAAKKKTLTSREKYLIKTKSKKMKRDIVNNFSRNSEMFARSASSAASEMSFVSDIAEEKRQPVLPEKRKIIYEGDEIVFPLKRTRSVSRSHQQNVTRRETEKAKQEGQSFEDTVDSCEVCGYYCLKNLDFYTAHKVQVHGLCCYFRCKYCNNYYLTEEHLSHHIKTHVNPIACPICKQITLATNSVAFASHMEQHIKELYDCRFCNKPFNTKENLNDHIATKHKRKRLFYTKNEGRILSTCVYKPEPPKDTGPKKYTSFDYGNLLKKEVEDFRPTTWLELDYLSNNDDDCASGSSGEQLPKSWREDAALNQDCRERLTETPDSDGSFYDYRGIPPMNTIRRKYKDPSSSRPSSSISMKSSTSSGHYTVYSKGGRSPSWESGRSTPWTNGSAGEEDQEVMRMMNNQTPFDLGSVRDLESRNTEVAEILAGEEEEDYDRQSYEDNAEEVDRDSNNSDDLDIDENQYLVGNNFVSSISYMDTEL